MYRSCASGSIFIEEIKLIICGATFSIMNENLSAIVISLYITDLTRFFGNERQFIFHCCIHC